MAFVSTLGKVSAAKSSAARFPRMRLAGLEGAAVRRATPAVRRRLSGLEDLAALAVATRRTPVRSLRLGDMGKTTPRKVSVFRTTRLRGMGDSCVIDPATGGRVCTTAASTMPAIVPMAAPPGTYMASCRNIVASNGILTAVCDQTPAGPGHNWVPTSLPGYASCAGQDIANVGGVLRCCTGSSCPQFALDTNPADYTGAAAAPVVASVPSGIAPVPAASIPAVIDPATGVPFSQEYPANLLNPTTGYPYSYTGPTNTIQPAYPYSSPSSFVSTAPGMVSSGSSGYDWKTIAMIGGAVVIGGIVLKKIWK
jgi:hypothetical protein